MPMFRVEVKERVDRVLVKYIEAACFDDAIDIADNDDWSLWEPIDENIDTYIDSCREEA